MPILEKEYRELFAARNDNAETHEQWLAASMAVLGSFFANAKDGRKVAASRLAAAWSFEGRRALAYSSYCFWYRPLWEAREAASLGQTGVGPDCWKVSDTYRRLARAVSSDEGEAGSADLFKETNRRLDLAATALMATRGRFDVDGYRSFQLELYGYVLNRLASDAFFKSQAKAWPSLDLRAAPRLSADQIDNIKKMRPGELAQKVSGIMYAAAWQAYPSLFEDMPRIQARVFEPDTFSGCYDYNDKTATYAFNEDTPFVFSSMPDFLVNALHEGEHLLGIHLSRKGGSLSDTHPLKKAALLFSDEWKAFFTEKQGKDAPVSFIGGGPRWMKKAYMSRPTEYYAYRGTALGVALAEKWKVPFFGNSCVGLGDVSVAEWGRAVLGLGPTRPYVGTAFYPAPQQNEQVFP